MSREDDGQRDVCEFCKFVGACVIDHWVAMFYNVTAKSKEGAEVTHPEYGVWLREKKFSFMLSQLSKVYALL